MAQYIKSLKRVVQNGDNKALEEYDFAVKAENVIVTTSDGNEETVQDALLQFTEPTTFTLDNSQTNWNVDNKISWQMICDSLENNTIQNYLKAGDEIDIQVGNETLPFFVLGVNTYNGQPKDQFGKSHIDLGCPQMSKILPILEAYRPNPSSRLIKYFPFGNVSDNNGEIINNETYPTFFSKSNFKTMNNYYKTILASNVLQLDSDSFDHFVKPKVLFLDKRLGIKDELLDDLTQLFPRGSSLYEDLVSLNEKIPNPLPIPEEGEDAFPEPAWSSFIEAAIEFLRVHADNRSAMAILQTTMKMRKNKVLQESETAEARFSLTVQKATIGSYDRPKIAEFMSKICTVMIIDYKIAKYSNDYVRIFNDDVTDPFPLFWGITEYELFGSCILGDKKYSQGQNFQYPIFKNLLNKERFIGANKEIKDFATITPVDGSTNELVGCRTKEDDKGNLLCARPIALPVYDPTSTTYNYDTALCFRLQA